MDFEEQDGLVIWLTGMSGSGKSTLAKLITQEMEDRGRRVKILDGDEVREYLTSDLGFSKEDRNENIKRIGFVSKAIADVGGIAIVAAISPYEESREIAKKYVGESRFFMVYVDCDLDTLTKRDVKGLYTKAISGEIKNFTGISDPYEVPTFSDCSVNSGEMSEEETFKSIMNSLDLWIQKMEEWPER